MNNALHTSGGLLLTIGLIAFALVSMMFLAQHVFAGGYLAPVTNFTHNGGLTISWDKHPQADGYRIVSYFEGDDYDDLAYTRQAGADRASWSSRWDYCWIMRNWYYPYGEAKDVYFRVRPYRHNGVNGTDEDARGVQVRDDLGTWSESVKLDTGACVFSDQ